MLSFKQSCKSKLNLNHHLSPFLHIYKQGVRASHMDQGRPWRFTAPVLLRPASDERSSASLVDRRQGHEEGRLVSAD